MKKKNLKKRDIIKILKILLILIGILVTVFILKTYLFYIDKKATKISDSTQTTIEASKITDTENGLYHVEIAKDIKKYLKSSKRKDLSALTYKIDGEEFYFEIGINKDGKEYSFDIEKIVDNRHQVSAKILYRDLKTLEYRTGNSNHSTLIKLFNKNDSNFLVFTENEYYFLGVDIEDISYKGNHFYYLSYNPKYESLRNTTEGCTDVIKDEIEDFKDTDYYYKYGKIYFLNDSEYEKLDSSKYTVADRCAEFEPVENTEEEKEEE